ncbi:MAG: SDR family NAD(P)-dependent oxidoreductase [Pseudomonadales bacterium]
MTIRLFIRNLFVQTPYALVTDLTGKHVIVTGTSRGSLGFETAKTLARWGAVVIVTTRSNTESVIRALTEELSGENTKAQITGHELDLCDAESVNAFAQWYMEQCGQRLDVLVNNAGVHLDLMSKWKQPKLTADGHEIQWRTNYLGTAQLTHKLLPLLQTTAAAQGEARIVNVGSQIHNKGSNAALFNPDTPYNSWQSYGLSKLGLIHLTSELHRQFAQNDNLKSYCLHPGSASGTYTGVADKGFEGQAVINFLRKLGAPIEKLFMSTAEEGAQTQLFCATSAQAESGSYYQNCAIHEASTDSQDEKAATHLWQETLDWVNGLPDSN